MYRAKDAGRNRAVVFEPSMGALVRGRVELDRALRQALGRGELDVAYQPIVDLVTGTLLGFEALARWNRPGRRPVDPRRVHRGSRGQRPDPADRRLHHGPRARRAAALARRLAA